MDVEIPGFGPLSEIGRGGFGVVYRAEDRAHGRTVAIKILRNALDADGQARFERECRAAGSLSGHPNIVSIHHSGVTSGGDPYLVMDHLGGGSLAERVARNGPLDPSEAIALGVGLAGALGAAHEAGIIHRDVKPENVLYSSFDVPQLVDFGIARMASEFETRSSSISASIAHAPPEVLAGTPASPAADVYSLASILHFALSGAAPFASEPEESLAPLIVRISTAPPPDLRQHGVPEALAALVEHGLAKDPADRPESATSFGEELRNVARGLGEAPPALVRVTPVVVAPDPTVGEVDPHATTAPGVDTRAAEALARLPRRRGVFITVAIGLVVVGLVAAFLVTRGRDGDAGDEVATGPSRTEADPLRVEQEQIRQGGLDVVRSFEITDDATVGSTVELANDTEETVERVWFEVVPKELASRVADVDFSREPTGVVLDDPVVYWVLTLDPGARQELSWSTALPADGAATPDYLAEVIELHAAAVADAEDAIIFASAALEADTGAEAVDPGVSVPVGGGEGTDGSGTGNGESAGPGGGDGGITDPGGSPGGGDPEGSPGGGDPGSGSGNGPVATTQPTPITAAPTTTTTTTRPLAVPGKPSNVVVKDPTGTRQSVAVTLTWSAPAGPVTRYRIRHQQWYHVGCDGGRTSTALVNDAPATGTSATRSTTTEQGCSWIVWQVAAENAAGVGPWVTATGIVPSVRNRDAAYHLVRAVGGRAISGGEIACGVPAYYGCGTSPEAGTSIAAGTTVAVSQQEP